MSKRSDNQHFQGETEHLPFLQRNRRGRLSPIGDNRQDFHHANHLFKSPQCHPAISLATTDLSCEKGVKDLTCRQYAADEIMTMASQHLDPNIAAETRGHLHVEATNTAFGWQLEVPH